MMRPVLLAYPPLAPSGLTGSVGKSKQTKGVNLTWTDNSLSETAFVVEKFITPKRGVGTWTEIGRVNRALNLPNTAGTTTSFNDPSGKSGDQYRVVALNTVGDTWDYANPAINQIVSGGFPTVTTKSGYSAAFTVP